MMGPGPAESNWSLEWLRFLGILLSLSQTFKQYLTEKTNDSSDFFGLDTSWHILTQHLDTVCTPLKLHQWSPWHGQSILENHAGNRWVCSFGCWCQTCFSTLFGMMVRKCPRYLYTFSGGRLKPATNPIWMYMVSVFTAVQKVPGPGCSRQLAAEDPGDWTAARAAPKATGSCRARVAWSCLMKAGVKFNFIILCAC